MGDVLLTPPISPAASSTPETSDVATLSAIDELLEKYLHLLDEHQKLQDNVKKHFSAGSFSLACANRSSPPGRRYGEDYYDERMKATRRVVTKSSESSLPNTELCNLACKNHAPSRFAIVQENPGESENNGTSEIRDVNHSQKDAADEDNLPLKTNLKPTSSNPLHWFGILVPAGLRDAQRSFATVVDAIPALANVITEMREVEQKVHDLRKVLLVEDKLEGLKLGQNSLA